MASSPSSGLAAPLGQTLRDLRLARGLSLAQAAARGGVSKSALAHWETGRRTPPGSALVGLLNALGASGRARAAIVAQADPRHARAALAHTPHGAPVGKGEVLRAMRLRRGLTQADLAGLLNVAQSTVARWERGDGDLDAADQEGVLSALGASADEGEAVASLDPTRTIPRDLDERYTAISRAPHGLGETLWLGLEADLWWRASRSEGYDELLQRVRGHRADWYAMSLRPAEADALARGIIRGPYAPPSEMLHGVAYGVVCSALQSRNDPRPALSALDAWVPRLRTPKSLALVQALHARLASRIDVDAGLDAMDAAERTADDDPDVLRFIGIQKARLLVDHGAPQAALLTLEEGALFDDVPPRADAEDTEYLGAVRMDAMAVRALALARLGEEPPEAWMAAIRNRRATRQIPLYRERWKGIERTVARLRGGSPLAAQTSWGVV